MRIALLRPTLALSALLGALLALSACAGGNAGSGQADAERVSTAPPPPDLVLPTSDPAKDASGQPLIAQPLSNEAVAAPSDGAPGKVDYSCRTDADCAVKNVGNCCGYYPACVNVDSPTFPEQVKADCAKNDMMAVCGFADIAGCQCIEGRCAAGPATDGEAVR
jgi:hypothetical protein